MKQDEFSVVEITFKCIVDIWENKLWPNRKSKIKPMSSMIYPSGYDMNIYDLYEPTFFGIFDDSKLIAVNSGHRTDTCVYRSRGIYVDSLYRGHSLSSKLFTEIDAQAAKEHCTKIWSLPRQGSEFAYLKNGYKQTSNWINEGVEFGPNCYVLKEI